MRGESLHRDLEEARKFASPDRQLLKEDVREEEVLISYRQLVKTHAICVSICLHVFCLNISLPSFLPVTYLVCLNSKCGPSANKFRKSKIRNNWLDLQLADLPQIWHFADLRFTGPIFFVICGD